MDFPPYLFVDHPPPWNLVVLLLVIYPIVILAPAAVCRRRGGSLLAFAFPAALTPLFVALALSWFEQARVLRAVVIITRYRPATSALALSEALQALRLGVFIAVVVVVILVLWEAVRRREDRAQASRRWLSLPPHRPGIAAGRRRRSVHRQPAEGVVSQPVPCLGSLLAGRRPLLSRCVAKRDLALVRGADGSRGDKRQVAGNADLAGHTGHPRQHHVAVERVLLTTNH